MRRLGLALAFGVLAAGTAAQAQVINVTGASDSTVFLDGQKTFSSPGTFQQGNNGGTVASSFDLSNPALISFESGNSSSGFNVKSTSTSSVNITILNGGTKAVAPTLQSQITAAGLGMYLANHTGGCGGNLFSGCPQTTGGQTFADLPDPNGAAAGTVVAYAKFDFNVSTGGSSLYDFNGIETMTVGADGHLLANNLLLSSPNVLQGLVKLEPGGAGSALGYAWNASNVVIGLGGDLAAGDSRVVTYSSTVETMSRNDCVAADPNVCLVAYSAFGDPVGRDGSVNNLRFGGGGQSLRFGGPATFGTGGITGVNFKPTVFDTPTFDNGVLTFGGDGVPEPATWMSLIGGFGLLGAALRRRRVLAYN